jgi:multiple antibiotic resistance protein
MNIQSVLSVSLILFSVIDIVGTLPVIIDLKNKGVQIDAKKAALYSLLLLTIFLISGEGLLGLFGVDVKSFAVAGSIILLFLGLEMILGIRFFKESSSTGSGTLVPVVFPLIAGAGTMTTVISLKSKYEALDIMAAIVINMVLVFFVLRSTGWLKDRLGDAGIEVLRKVFGIILLAIAIRLFKENFHIVITPDKHLTFAS